MGLTEENRQKVIDKIRKLLALSSSTNEHEALAAAEKVQALLAEYNLSTHDLGSKSDLVIRDKDLLTYYASWVKSLIGSVARLYFCGYFFENYPVEFLRRVNLSRADLRPLLNGWGHKTFLRHNFIGEQANIIVAKQMAEYLISAMERLCKEGKKTVPAGERPSYEGTFMNTCAQRLCYRLQQRRTETAEHGVSGNGTNLPALRSLYQQSQDAYDKWCEDSGLKMKQSKNLGKFTHGKGARDGIAAGDKIGLDQQLASHKNNRMITH